jgi:hypothetical protein
MMNELKGRERSVCENGGTKRYKTLRDSQG